MVGPDEALEEVDFMISVDPRLTKRHDMPTDPATTSPLEHDHYDIAFHNLAIRNTARYSAVSTSPSAMHDWRSSATGCARGNAI